MTINRGFNVDASVSSADTDEGSEEPNAFIDTYAISASVSTGPIEGSSDGTGAVVSADATAIGEDTFASVSANGNVNAGPIATSTEVSVTTDAVAASGGQSYTSATGSIELIGGADWSFRLSYDFSAIDQDAGGMTASSSSIDYMYALSIDEFGISVESSSNEVADDGSPLMTEPEPQSLDYAYDDPCGCGDDGSIPFDGNVAVFNVDFAASAEDAFIEVDLFSLAVEDQMSSVTLGGIILIG